MTDDPASAACSAASGFAVDIGGTKMAAARIADGAIEAREQEPTRPEDGPEAQLDHAADLLAQLGYRRGDQLGIAVAGRITAAGEWRAVNVGTLAGGSAAALGTLVRERFGHAAIANDAAAAGLAEATLGAGRGVSRMVYATVSTGVGGAIVLGGTPLVSASGLAGHIGFMSSPLGGEARIDGRRGTVEGIAGGKAIAAAARVAGHDVDARGVFEAALGGEGWAEAIAARATRAVAVMLTDLQVVLDAERVVVGGAIGLSPGYLARLQAWLDEEPEHFRPSVRPAELGADSTLLGAALLPRREDDG